MEHVRAAQQGFDIPVEVVPDEQQYDPNNAPFAMGTTGEFMHPNRAKGTIQIHPRELESWLEQEVPKGQEQRAIRARLEEEKIHLATPDRVARRFRNASTWIQKKISDRRYTGNWQGVNINTGEAIPDLNLAHEQIRFEMQRAAGMEPSEYAQATLLDRIGLKSLTALSDAIQATREALGRRASAYQKALLGKMQFNVFAAQQAASGNPAALRKTADQPRELLDEVSALSPADFAAATKEVEGGWTKLSQRLGEKIAKDPEMLAKALELRQQAEAEANQYLQEGDFNNGMAAATKRQFFNEAYQVATKTGGFAEKAPAGVRRKKDLPGMHGQGGLLLTPRKAGEEMQGIGFPVPNANEIEAAARAHFDQAIPVAGESLKARDMLRTLRRQLKDAKQQGIPTAGLERSIEETEKQAEKIPDFAKKMSLEQFQNSLRMDFGAGISKDALYYAWQDELNRRLMGAPGEEIGRMMRELGLTGDVAEAMSRDWVGKIPDAAVEAPTQKTMFALTGATEGERARASARQEKANEQQRTRMAAIGAVMDKLTQQAGGKPEKPWDRPSIGPEDLMQGYAVIQPGGETSEGEQLTPEVESRRLTTRIAPDMAKNAPFVADLATRGAAVEASGKGAPPRTVSRNVLVLQGKNGGIVVVSAWRDPRTGPKVINPVSKTDKSLAISDALLKDWTPRAVMTLREPVQGLRQEFPTVQAFDQYFGHVIEEEPAAAPIPGTPGLRTSSYVGPNADIANAALGKGGKIPGPGQVELAPSEKTLEARVRASQGLPTPPRPVPGPSYAEAGTPTLTPTTPPARPGAFTAPEMLPIPEVKALEAKIAESYPEAEKFPNVPLREVLPGLGKPTGKVSSFGTPAKLGPGYPLRAGIEGTVVGRRTPAALAKRLQNAKDTFEMFQDAMGAAVLRRSVKRDLPRLLDAADGPAAQMPIQAGQAIRIASQKVPTNATRAAWKAESAAGKTNRMAGIAYVASGDLDAAGNWKANPDRLDKWVTLPTTGKSGPPAALPPFTILLNRAEYRAKAWQNHPTVLTRAESARDLEYVKQLREGLAYAKAHWNDPEFKAGAEAFRKEMKDHIDWQNALGFNVTARENYIPGVYEGQFWSDNLIRFVSNRLLGTQYRLPKTFNNPYEAIVAGPYRMKSLDLAEIAEHRIQQGVRQVERDLWFKSLLSIPDPDSKKPIALNPDISKGFDPQTGKERFYYKSPDANYVLVYPRENVTPLAIRQGFENLVKAMVKPSLFEQVPGAKDALRVNQLLKHGVILLWDTFHPGRLLQYATALGGLADRDGGPRWAQGGSTALRIRPQDLDAAVAKGFVSKEAADWARKPLTLRPGVVRTQQQILDMMIREGFNVVRLKDAMYRSVVEALPLIGKGYHDLLAPYNTWLFERLIPGMMAETAVRNFVKAAKKYPTTRLDRLMKDVVTDTNVFFGNLGRQGLLKSRTMQDLAQLIFLAPNWQEGLMQKEIRFGARVAGAAARGVGIKTGYRQGLPAMGPLGEGMAKGLLSYFLATQLINLASRRKPTWENEEEGHKLDAWMPVGNGGVWLSPLSVFAEITHDLMRLTETKPKVWDAVLQMGENRLAPVSRMGLILATGKSPQDQYFATTPGVLGAAARQVIPLAGAAPITFAVPTREIAHKLAPGSVSPNQPGALWRQLLAAGAGVKTQLERPAATQAGQLAREFMQREGLTKTTGWREVQVAEEPSFSKLRSALRNNDLPGARDQYELLLEQHKPSEVLHSMNIWARRPFTGSNATETLFKMSLDDKQLEIYTAAQLERMELLAAFQEFQSQQ